MKKHTAFALTYFFTNTVSATQPPTVHVLSCETSAKEMFFEEHKWRLFDVYPDLLAEALTSKGFEEVKHDDKERLKEIVEEMILQGGYDELISLLMDFEDGSLFYQIQQVRTIGIIDEAIESDSIEVDGHFVRHYNLDENDREGLFLEAELVDDEYNHWRFAFSRPQLLAAKWDHDREHWVVKDDEEEIYIKFFKFEK